MGKDTYVVFDAEGGRESPYLTEEKGDYDPGRWEEIRIDFIVPLPVKPGGEGNPERRKRTVNYPEVECRQNAERRSGTERRTGSRDRRSWQDYKWIGPADCRSEQLDRRRGRDRRKNPDRRRR